jgi:hypothetical protein
MTTIHFWECHQCPPSLSFLVLVLLFLSKVSKNFLFLFYGHLQTYIKLLYSTEVSEFIQETY